MTLLLCEDEVVDNYITSSKINLEKGIDKRFPNLNLVRIAQKEFDKKEASILDYGCGFGANLVFLAEMGFRLTGLDVSPHALQAVSNKLSIKNISADLCLLDRAASQLDFSENTFDYIVCASVLSLLGSRERVLLLLNEFKRVLKPEGRLYLDVNGLESEFVRDAEKISDFHYIYSGHNTSVKPFKIYCPDENNFNSVVGKVFKVINSGFSAHKYLNYSEHELIVLAGNKK